MMKFLGIDLGWRSQPSGLCCLAWEDNQLHLLDLDRKEAIEDILDWVDTWAPPPQCSLILSGTQRSDSKAQQAGEAVPPSPVAPLLPLPLCNDGTQLGIPKVGEGGIEPAIVAVDAPTLIPNATGSRLPDKLSHKYFGRYHAGCYPANLSLPFAQRTVSFGLELEARGFAHAPAIVPQQLGRFQIEVFPHPAIVHLFGLERILKYKKGRLSERRLELMKLQHYILEILPTLIPPLNPDFRFSILDCGVGVTDGSAESKVTGQTLIENPAKIKNSLTGAALKAVEDKLDALICAYVAAHWWYWGLERNLVLGDATTGYIVVPTLRE